MQKYLPLINDVGQHQQQKQRQTVAEAYLITNATPANNEKRARQDVPGSSKNSRALVEVCSFADLCANLRNMMYRQTE